MKTNNFKKIMSTLAVIATISFGTMVKADEITLPVITKPAILEEGTQRELNASQIAELLPWAKDSKVFLNDLLDSTQGLSSTDKHDRLVEAIKSVVGESAPKHSELLMRYVLNRGIVIDEILTRELNEDAVGTIDAKNRVLVSTIKMAIKYYDTDMQVLARKTKASYVLFGVDYFEFLNELNKSVFDASAQYSIQRTSLEWLQWDLYRDLNNASYAAQIVKINNSLKIFPTKKLTDAQSISFIRQMKAVAQQLRVRETLAKLDNDFRISQAASEQERQRLLREQQEQEQIERMGPIVNTVQVFTRPSLNGVLFSSTSRPNGVCKLLGYQKAADQQMTADGNVRGSLIIVNEDATVTRGEQATDRVGATIASVTCLNKVLTFRQTLMVEKLDNFSINGVLVSSQSNESGACRALGYESGIVGTGVANGNVRGSMAIINAKGEVSGGEVATERTGAAFSQLVCVNKRNGPTLTLQKIIDPSIQGNVVSSNSNVIGVCKLLGYRSGSVGSGVADGNVRGPMLVIDVTGEIVNSETATERVGAKYSSIICIK